LSEKPRLRLASTAAEGLCHWCLQVPRYTIVVREKTAVGVDVYEGQPTILRVCRAHLVFVQSHDRAPELLHIDGYERGIDLSRAEDYVQRKHYTPDIQGSPLSMLKPG